MPWFSWRRRTSEHFGETWVPFADLSLQAADGSWQPFSFQIDSGAVVTLARRSVGQLLGLRAEAGRRINLGGIGAVSLVVHVHEVQARLGDEAYGKVPIAIAEIESVPNLLGRSGFFDRLQVNFDATLKETVFLGRWLEPDQAQLWRQFVEMDTGILGRWKAESLPPPADRVVPQFLARAGQLATAVAVLIRAHRQDSIPPLLRALLEVSIQFEYLVTQPAVLAQRFLDYKKVRKWISLQAYQEHVRGQVGQRVRSLAPATIDAIEQDYESVKDRFTRANGKIMNSWHGLQMRALCERMHREYEYHVWYAMWSNWTHMDPLEAHVGALKFGGDKPIYSLIHAIRLYARILLLISSNLILTAEEYKLLQEWAKDFS